VVLVVVVEVDGVKIKGDEELKLEAEVLNIGLFNTDAPVKDEDGIVVVVVFVIWKLLGFKRLAGTVRFKLDNKAARFGSLPVEKDELPELIV
jgi:hypothetical protein